MWFWFGEFSFPKLCKFLYLYLYLNRRLHLRQVTHSTFIFFLKAVPVRPPPEWSVWLVSRFKYTLITKYQKLSSGLLEIGRLQCHSLGVLTDVFITCNITEKASSIAEVLFTNFCLSSVYKFHFSLVSVIPVIFCSEHLTHGCVAVVGESNCCACCYVVRPLGRICSICELA